jgi:hypothetical protein
MMVRFGQYRFCRLVALRRVLHRVVADRAPYAANTSTATGLCPTRICTTTTSAHAHQHDRCLRKFRQSSQSRSNVHALSRLVCDPLHSPSDHPGPRAFACSRGRGRSDGFGLSSSTFRMAAVSAPDTDHQSPLKVPSLTSRAVVGVGVDGAPRYRERLAQVGPYRQSDPNQASLSSLASAGSGTAMAPVSINGYAEGN